MSRTSSAPNHSDRFRFSDNTPSKESIAASHRQHSQAERTSFIASAGEDHEPHQSSGHATQKRVFSSASSSSYSGTRRVFSSASRKSTSSSHSERVSVNNYFDSEPNSRRVSPQVGSHQRSSSFFGNEDLVFRQPAQYKPYYAQQLAGTSSQFAAAASNAHPNNTHLRHSYHVANVPVDSTRAEHSYQMANVPVESARSEHSGRHSMHTTFNSGSAVSSVPSRSSMRKQPTFGPYLLGKTIGEGEFGKVKLAWSTNKKNKDSFSYHMSKNACEMNTTNRRFMEDLDPEDMPKQVAIKLIKNSSIPEGSETETKLFREINSLRVLTHPNIVRLEEVIRNDTHIGIVMEYASGGEFYKYIQEKKRLKESEGCRLFAQLISGVQYMHSKGMAHRDLKLENLLLDRFENLIITDFGFVNEFQPGKNELMKTSCGSPCYAAPELVVSSRPYSAKKADLWSCGIILFAILAGYLPWDDDSNNPDGDDIAKLYMYITQTPLKFPEYITPVPRDLLRRILVPNPKHRLAMEQVYQHKWLASHTPFLSISPDEWDRFLSSDNNKVYRSKQTQNTRQVKPRSSFSANGEKRSSLILENSYSAKALPPKESHTVATIKTDQLPTAIAVQNMNYGAKKSRHESFDFSQLSSNQYYGHESNPAVSRFEYEKPAPITAQNDRVLFASANPSEVSISQSSTDSSVFNKNNSAVSFHRKSNSAASVVLQQVIDESNSQLQQQQQQAKFQPTKPKRTRPMSFHPGSTNFFEFNTGTDNNMHDFSAPDRSYNMANPVTNNLRTAKHSSVIHEEEGPDMENYKLNRFNQPPLESEVSNRNYYVPSRVRNASANSGSTIGSPTRHSSTNSKYYSPDNLNESNQHTRVPSQGTPLSSSVAAENRKSKRFSLLSFYSLYDSSNSKTHLTKQQNNSTSNLSEGVGMAKKDGLVFNDDSPSKMSLQQRIFNSEGAPKNNRFQRYSVMGTESTAANNGYYSPPQHEPPTKSPQKDDFTSGNTSTTRKVIDFFKRRSLRL